MPLNQTAQSLRLYQWGITRQNHNPSAPSSQLLSRSHNGVPGASLFSLEHEVELRDRRTGEHSQTCGRVPDSGFDFSGLMTDNRENSSWSQFEGGSQNVSNKR
jgi:hypothetical protein